MNLTVDLESVAAENAAFEGLVNDPGYQWNTNITDIPVSSGDGPMPDVDIVGVRLWYS